MAQYETYQSNAAELPFMRKWLLRALVISLLIHAGLLVFFHFKRLDNFGYTDSERLAPPIYKLQRISIPEMPEEVKLVLPDKKPVQAISIPSEKPSIDEMVVKPMVAPEASAPIVQEKPKVDLSGGFDQLADKGNSVAQMEKQLLGVAGSLVDKTVKTSNPRVLQVPVGNKRGDGGSGDSGGIPGRQSIDDALNKVGGPVSNRAVAMRGGALFEWGKADLKDEAVQDLQKLGQLIKQNPKATFIISGHTDHTGTHETNLLLSQQRADSVRDWLVANLGIDPMRITTVGKADDEALPTLGPDKSIDEQAPNRRVEIVIKTNRK